VGGVSGRPARARRGAILSRARCCNGGRHPGPRDAANLRGLSEERESWSVRRRCVGLVPMQLVAPATTGVLWKKEEGNVLSMRQAHALSRETPKSASRKRKRKMTRPSLGPETRARQSALSSHGPPLLSRQAVGGVAVVEISRSGKPGSPGGTGTGVTVTRTTARLAAYHRFSCFVLAFAPTPELREGRA